jgi:hypothetical protein
VQALARDAALVDLGRGPQGALGVDVEVRMDVVVDVGGPVEVGLGQLDRADLLVGEQARHLCGAEPDEIGGHVFFSTLVR